MGWTSYEYMTDAIEKAAADDAVRAIVLDIDGPGGTVAGTPPGRMDFTLRLDDCRKPRSRTVAVRQTSVSDCFGA